MGKRKGVQVLIGILLVAALVLTPMACKAPEVAPPVEAPPEVAPPEEVGVVKFGYTGPLTGPAALWGVNGLRGLEMWADSVNAAGGIEVAGKRYMVETITYDGKATPSEVLKLTRRLVMEDKVDVVSNFLFADAAAPFLTERQMLQFTLIGSHIRPGWPYLIGAGNADPEYMSATVMWVKENLFPDMQRFAITSQDDKDALRWRRWYSAQAEFMGMEVVYNKPFAIDTIDFAPIVSSMLATNPDVLCWDGSWPDFNGLLTEQAYIQGFNEGPIISSSHEIGLTLSKVPSEWLEGRFITSYAYWDDPEFCEKANAIFAEQQSRYGGDPWMCDTGIIAEQAVYWEQAVKIAGTFDSTAVSDVLLNTDVHSLWGNGPANAYWYGDDMYGIANYILPERWAVAVFHEGRDKVAGWVSLRSWWEEYGDRMMEALDEAGLMWYQQ